VKTDKKRVIMAGFAMRTPLSAWMLRLRELKTLPVFQITLCQFSWIFPLAQPSITCPNSINNVLSLFSYPETLQLSIGLMRLPASSGSGWPRRRGSRRAKGFAGRKYTQTQNILHGRCFLLIGVPDN
jgi:hypothetical protein